jgi:hypothetical protein
MDYEVGGRVKVERVGSPLMDPLDVRSLIWRVSLVM